MNTLNLIHWTSGSCRPCPIDRRELANYRGLAFEDALALAERLNAKHEVAGGSHFEVRSIA
jgi:hypothetical protein